MKDYSGLEARIVSETGQLRWFGIERNLRLGCNLSPTLFKLYVSRMVAGLEGVGLGVGHYSIWMILCFWQTQEWSFKTCWMWSRIMSSGNEEKSKLMVVRKGGMGLKWKLIGRS